MRPYVGRRRSDIIDPILEPLWSGLRVIAHLGPIGQDGSDREVRLLVDPAADVQPELREVARTLGRSVDAGDAILDGVITRQVGWQGLGAAVIPEVRASPSRLLLGNTADLEIVPRGSAAHRPEQDEEGFVAVDLLRVDGVELLDVPLLERKRLLESVVRESDLIRVSVHTRPPIDTWIASWKALGLRGGILKAANSRYQPGARSPEWRMVEAVGRRGG